MKKKIVIHIEYWALTEQINKRLTALSARNENLAGNLAGSEGAGDGLSSMAPLTLLAGKMRDLRKHIRRYARKSMPLILNLRNIDRQLACSDLLQNRSVMITELERLTNEVIEDIEKKQIFLADFIDPAKTYSLANILDNSAMFREIREACTEFRVKLDRISELILTYSKYTSRKLDYHKSWTNRVRKNMMLHQKEFIPIQDGTGLQSREHRLAGC